MISNLHLQISGKFSDANTLNFIESTLRAKKFVPGPGAYRNSDTRRVNTPYADWSVNPEKV